MFLQMSIVNDNYVSEIPKESEAIIVKKVCQPPPPPLPSPH